MAGKKAKGRPIADLVGRPRKHYCPDCPADGEGNTQPSLPIMMVTPRKKILFVCKAGHYKKKNETILLAA